MCCHKQLECAMQISRGDSKTTELNWNGFILLFFYYYSFCSSFVCYCKFNDLFIVFLVVFSPSVRYTCFFLFYLLSIFHCTPEEWKRATEHTKKKVNNKIQSMCPRTTANEFSFTEKHVIEISCDRRTMNSLVYCLFRNGGHNWVRLLPLTTFYTHVVASNRLWVDRTEHIHQSPSYFPPSATHRCWCIFSVLLAANSLLYGECIVLFRLCCGSVKEMRFTD